MKLKNYLFIWIAFPFMGFGQSGESIEKLLVFEKYGEAEKSALAWVQKDPQNAEAFFWAGKVFLAKHNVDSASLFFNRGLEVNPHFPYTFAGMISVAFLKNNAAVVPELVEKAKDLASRKDARIAIELAAAFLNAPNDADRSQVKSFADEAIKYDRKNYRIYLILGDYYLSNPSTTSLAAENYQKAVDYDKEALRAYIQKAAVYERVDNVSEAYAQYKKAIRVDETFPVAYQRLAEMFYRVHDWKGADTTYAMFLKYTEPSMDKLKRAAVFSFTARNYAGAIAKLQQILEKDPKDVPYLRLMANAYYEQNDSAAALKEFESLMRNPDSLKNSRDYEHYAKLLQRFSMDSLAIIAYGNAYAKDSTKSEYLSARGRLAHKHKNWKEVINALEPRISKFDDADFFDYLFLGQACYYDSSYQLAKTSFEKMIAKYPKHFVGYLWLSNVCVAIQPDAKEGLAKPSYEKLIELLTDKVKYKAQLVNAHSYLGVYYYKNQQPDLAKNEWTQIQDIDPENQQAVAYLKILNK